MKCNRKHVIGRIIRGAGCNLVAIMTISSLAATATAQVFFDDFNRPDSSAVGNGWTPLAGGSTTGLGIRSNHVSPVIPNGKGGIYRPFDFSVPVTVSATISEQNGFGGVPRRYDQTISIRNDGIIDHGYGIAFLRGDVNYNSTIRLFDGASYFQDITPSFQFGPEINTSIKFSPDGSVSGRVWQGNENFTFTFPARAIQSTGGNFAYATGYPDGRSSSFIFPRLDDLRLQSDPRLFVIAVGSSDVNKWGITTTDGQGDAAAIEAKLRRFESFTESQIIAYRYDVDSSSSLIKNAVDNIASKVRPNDTVVFYYGGHGFGGLNVEEGLALNRSASVLDNELKSWFNNATWADVHKLFIFDSCFAGGFARSSDTVGIEDDLSSLTRTAILAGATETGLSGSSLSPLTIGRGKFTMALEDALTLIGGYARADRDKDGLSFPDLQSYLSDFFSSAGGYQGFIRDFYDDDEGNTLILPQIEAWQSADFSLSVPEPQLSALIAVGALILVARRSRN